jgi:hypothetical protein
MSSILLTPMSIRALSILPRMKLVERIFLGLTTTGLTVSLPQDQGQVRPAEAFYFKLLLRQLLFVLFVVVLSDNLRWYIDVGIDRFAIDKL